MTSIFLRVGDFVRELSGWRRFGTALAAGGVSALGFAPLNIFPALLIALAALVLLLDSTAQERHRLLNAALTGWAFGFGQFAVGMHWIFYPFLVDPAEHAWQIPFVALLFPGGLALFTALATTLSAAFWKAGSSRIYAIALSYAATEWLRGHILTGFPWNLPAYSWGASLAVMQSMALVGAYGLSFLTIVFGASFAELFGKSRHVLVPVLVTGMFAVLWLGGELRLNSAPIGSVPGVRLRIVQPNIPQDEKYQPRLVQRNWDRLIDLSVKPSATMPTVIIWPEAAPPVLLQRSSEALDQIAGITGVNRALITGNERVTFDPSGKRKFYNSLYIFGAHGRLLSTYDKFHLVPFGEYLPFESTLRELNLTKLVNFPGSFSSGDGPHTYKIPGTPAAGPLICYEILFPGAVIGEKRPNWLINVTDDSWFGPWAGPQQHLLAARARAIEEGLPVARAANTGISAVIDPLGRTVAALGLDETGEIDSQLPRALSEPIYARYGDIGFFLMLLVSAGLSWLLARK